MQAFCLLKAVLAAASIDRSLGSTSYSMYFTSRVVPNTEIQTYSFYPNKIFQTEA